MEASSSRRRRVRPEWVACHPAPGIRPDPVDRIRVPRGKGGGLDRVDPENFISSHQTLRVDANSNEGGDTGKQPGLVERARAWRPTTAPVRKRRTQREPWVIGFIAFTSLIVLAVCIGLIVHYVRYNQKKPYNYLSTLKFTSNQSYHNFGKEASQNYTKMSQAIETLVSKAFLSSMLRRQYVKSQIIRFSPEEAGVMAHMLMNFRFPSTTSPQAVKNTVTYVLSTKLKGNTLTPKVDPNSINLTRINKEQSDDYVNSCCGTRRSKANADGLRIVGGNPVEDGEWPWQASLQYNGIHRCGATLINSTWIVSAAHCFRSYADPSRWTVSFGVTVKPGKERRGLKKIIIHEKYHYPDHNFDISLAELSSPVPYSNAVHRVCLPDASYRLKNGDTMYVTGFGAEENDGMSQNTLREVQVRYIDSEICNEPQIYNNAISPGMLCAGYLEGKRDACQGDSGGPLVKSNARDIWYLMGIVSWGDECAQPNKPGVYTRVTFYRDWIASKTGI
ncbi:transmembrane protease serine 11E-like [Tachyglossus aculeatus]|uniref:transmembrane protease serine 11E-like n=1 Tax=Tachyglossus aculeatus TaxID=9261 RepID=UPI0018F43751|nr:transmembrane protease serine 11E-like [Tachyglossus aculeatus]